MPSRSRNLRHALEAVLRRQPGLTARQLASRLHTEGIAIDKSTVNSVLYGHAATFRHDGAVPPRWSLAAAEPRELPRASHLVSAVDLANWKVFESASVPMRSITLLFGENSSGKSSILQALLVMKQSWGHGRLQLDGRLGTFGWYEHVVHRQEVGRAASVRATWGAPVVDAPEWSVLMAAMPTPEDEAYDRTHPMARLVLTAGDETVALWPADAVPGVDVTTLSGNWFGARIDLEAEPDPAEILADGRIVVLGVDEHRFPDPDQVVFAATDRSGRATRDAKETLDVVRQVLEGAAEMFNSLEYIGPYRKPPRRDIELSWAMKRADYAASLKVDDDLVALVNEWLVRFEVPYTLSVADYGDNLFDLDLTRAGEAGERVQLCDVGFGVSQLLPIITQLLRSREKTILVEEPEAHVHPRLQSVLGDLLIESMQDYGNRLIVETHSEPLLLRLQRRVAETRLRADEIAVHHIIRRGVAAEVETAPLLASGQLDYQWPGGFFDDRMDDLLAILDPRPDE